MRKVWMLAISGPCAVNLPVGSRKGGYTPSSHHAARGAIFGHGCCNGHESQPFPLPPRAAYFANFCELLRFAPGLLKL